MIESIEKLSTSCLKGSTCQQGEKETNISQKEVEKQSTTKKSITPLI
jgi:hypothetical protein